MRLMLWVLFMPPLSIGFNVPFNEAIQATVARNIVLPDSYYGALQGIHRQLAFSVAGVASVDQLQGVLDSLASALKNGHTFAQWQKAVDVSALGLPKHRLDNIFRTNIQAAYNRGHWEQQVQNQATRPYLLYDAINDSRTRPSHSAMDGIIRPVGDPFWTTNYPPNGYRCRCSVISLNERQAKARSGEDKGMNKAITPATMQPDKGWDYNVGADLTAGVNRAIAERVAGGKVDKVLLSALEKQQATKILINYTAELDKVRRSVKSIDFARFYNGKSLADFKIGVLKPEDHALIASSSSEVFLSRASLDEHKIKHPEIGLAEYRLIPDILNDGQVWQVPDKLERIIFMKVGDITYRAVIKRTTDGDKVYLLTLFANTKAKPPKGAIRIR